MGRYKTDNDKEKMTWAEWKWVEMSKAAIKVM